MFPFFINCHVKRLAEKTFEYFGIFIKMEKLAILEINCKYRTFVINMKKKKRKKESVPEINFCDNNKQFPGFF